MADYTVYIDGMSSVEGLAGIGIVIVDNAKGTVREHSESCHTGSNIRVKIIALIKALSMLPKNSTAELFSDSKYIVQSMKGKWKKTKNKDLWEKAMILQADKKISYFLGQPDNVDQHQEKCRLLALSALTGNISNNKDYGSDQEKKLSYKEIAKKFNLHSMTVQIRIPEEFDFVPVFRSPEIYAAKYNVHINCAKSIGKFLEKQDKNWIDYANLCTDGHDYHSARPIEFVLWEFSSCNQLLRIIKQYCRTEKEQKSAVRWHARGLPLSDAIRKALVDEEIKTIEMICSNKKPKQYTCADQKPKKTRYSKQYKAYLHYAKQAKTALK